MNEKRKSPAARRIARMVALDLAALAACLLVFAYFHHVRREPLEPTALPTPTPTATPRLTAAPTATPEPIATPTPTPSGLLGGKYAEKFSQGEVVSTESEYRSAGVAVELTTENLYDSIIHVAEIYVQELSCFRTAVYDEFGDDTMRTREMAQEAGAIVALSGDFFTAHYHHDMFIVRNGNAYVNKQPERGYDTCVLYTDGVMETISSADFDREAVLARGVYQSWCFGPALLGADGSAIESFRSNIGSENPRSAIGYYEPGHYCLVMVEGRSRESAGMTLVQLSEFFASRGCVAAYNLDGGKTAEMAYQGELVNPRLGSGRAVSDILYVIDPENEAAAIPIDETAIDPATEGGDAQ